MDLLESESKNYYCAGRDCTVRENCHRHTSSAHVNDAPFYDYDLIKVKYHTTSVCPYYIDCNSAVGVKSK